MIQDIKPRIYHNEYHEEQPGRDAVIMIYSGNAILCDDSDEQDLRFPLREELDGLPLEYTYLFSIDSREFFLGTPTEENLPYPDRYKFEKTSILRTARPMSRAFAGITGHSLYHWYDTHRFCGKCGHPTVKDHKERMIRCPQCGEMVYPTISPAVIVGIIHDGKILMSKYSRGNYHRFALLAGFTEIGETVEGTVRREVMEEVGLKVKNLRYYKSQPWPFSSSVLMGFFCDLDGSDKITLEEDELKEAGWYTPDEVPDDLEHIAITQEMMTVFKNGTYPK